MKERPILFTGENVRAILEDRKTQTRRIIKPQPLDGCTVGWSTFSGENRVECRSYAIPHQSFIKVPFGKRGDRLWVKETFTKLPCENDTDVPCLDCQNCRDGRLFRADRDLDIKWKPSIFMPRWASRITLEITAIRVERLQDISEEDSKAEGIQAFPLKEPRGKRRLYGISLNQPGYGSTAKIGYQILWQSINGQGSWAANPWVWVIEFKKLIPTAKNPC